MMSIFNKKNIFEDYRELLSKDEAMEYQKRYYGEYCNAYNEDRVKMKKNRYEYRMTLVGIPIEAYIGNMFSHINAYLRGLEEPLGEYSRYEYNMLIDRINEIIYCAPAVPENIVVYRAIDDLTLKRIMHSVKEHGSYMEKGFLSTTLLKKTCLEEFRGEILKIYVPKDAHALGVDGIKDRGENEMLFPEQQHLIYVGKTKDKEIKKNIYEFHLIN